MSLVLNTNIDSMVAQNSLTASGAQLATALQQLSSGLRVNPAADDAAGYAIAQGMSSQINGLHQAAQNANDGVSLAQTASGALSEVTNDLQTMRDLAVESLNATNSASDRADLNSQFQQLAADINNVAANTQFNGVNLLDGSFQGADFQIGANAGQIISVSTIASAATSAIGNYYTTAATAGNTYATANVANGDTVTLSIQVGTGANDGAASVAAGAATAISTGPITLTGNQTTDLANIATAINSAVGSNQGIIATVNAATGSISLSTADATNEQSVQLGITASTGTFNTTAGTLANLGLGSAGAVVGPATAAYALGSNANTGLVGNAVANTLANPDVTTVDNSNLVLISVDHALQQLATTGASLGAYQNRFQAAITGLNVDATNLSSAKSSIVDTDYAQATSNLSKAQILQQASTAMVAQANTIPQNILTLLQKLP
ncbi:MAG: flagellin [Steroidobacteraceae bacterium]